jgi:hypothetical protein
MKKHTWSRILAAMSIAFAATALAAPTGVTINGEPLDDAVGSGGAGWKYYAPHITLTNAGPFTLSGANDLGKVRVVVQAGVTCDVTLSDLTLEATDEDQCAFALGTGANVSLSLAGESFLQSGSNRAGLEVPAGASLSITNAPGDDAGALTATGGDCAAGIGGGEGGSGGTVAISGGTVTATGTWGGAGIGGGDYGTGGTVAISGGIVFAQGDYGAGIGGGYNGDGGTVNISGGTVFAQGNRGGQDIGKGANGTDAGANTFTGGSIRLAAGRVSLQPSNNTEQVFCVMVSDFEPGERVEFTDPGTLPDYYGTDDIYADNDGIIYLWLPNGTYAFTANGRECTVTIKDGVGATGVTVNGEEAAFGPADPSAGWSFNAATRTVSLTGAGPFTLSGANTMGDVCFAVPDNIANMVTVTLSNLTLRAPADGQCAFALGQNANVSLLLAGANALASGSGRAGIEVATGRTLSITNAPGDDAGSLTATGGDSGAGIGGGNGGNGGTITISGGTVAATGGECAAGIGGGENGNGGTVAISGGTVTATGTYGGAGIGGGDYGTGATVAISGGIVFAQGDYGAGIGGGYEGDGGTVNISGGTVFAQGNLGGQDIGKGVNGTDAGANTFTGGSICLVGSSVGPDPTNGSVPVFCAVVSGFEPRALVEITGLAYGVHDIFADESGCIYLWLPNGTYTFTANGRECTVTIQGGVGPTGVTVNGQDVAFGPGPGWVYDGTARTLTISGAGPFLLSGTNTISGVRVVVPEDVTNTVTLSNLKLRATGDGQCAFALETDANVSLFLAGTNTLASGYRRAGLEVAAGRTLSITNAPGDDAGALTVTGGRGAAGIGGGYDGIGGTVTVNGGAVTAAGGYAGAGIGGGYNYSNIPNADTDSGGTVTVNGGAVTATGGYAGAGIGGGAFGGGGTVTVNGGVVTATGGVGGAGIGGGYNANGRTVTVNDGALTATGGHGGAGIGGGYNYNDIPNAETNSGGTVTINGGTVSAIGGRYAAGIGSGNYGGGGTVNISDGTVTATGGFDGAGIGGGYDGQGCTVTITGGGVSATGGDYAAGIGGGIVYDSTSSTAGWGGTVAISGGRVMATGGRYAAGIGGGSGWTVEGGDGADLTVSGGTVFATGGADGGPGIGGGVDNADGGGTTPNVSGTSTFTGGSIRILGGYAADDPTDDSQRVWCVTVTNLTPNAAVAVEALGAYGVNDLYADEAGQLYFWLPNNFYDFTAGGADYEATVSDADTTATQTSAPPAPVSVGVTVNGVELYDTGSNGEGWTYVMPTLTLAEAGPFTISGTNTEGQVQVVIPAGVTNEVTLSNLTLLAMGENQCAFALETNACVSLLLAGTNEFASGRNRAGLEVAAGRTLSITNAPGDDAGALTATSEDSGAGIGGGADSGGGTVIISGGIVTATGGEYFAAGIGGGMSGAGGTVSISGGTVTANGGNLGAGIGSGGYAGVTSGGAGGTVSISGGTVIATGGDWSAGIGGGDGDAGGTVEITGGTVTATGGQYGAGIGGGNNDQNDDGIAGSGGTVTISGGRVSATGGKCAAGIGGGTGQQVAGSEGATLTVSGGTVFATGGTGGAPGIGPGLGNVMYGDVGDLPDPSGTSTFTGGSIRIDGVYAANDPTDADLKRVWCVTVTNLTPNAAIAVGSLGAYGVNDLFADEAGKLYLWLPNAYYHFTADSAGYEATVSDADTTATPKTTPPPAPRAYITFSSSDTFKVKPGAKTWNGTLECSTNATDWVEFTTAGADAALDDASGEYRLYICGTNNTVITGTKEAESWTITAADGAVTCSGDIETLLDYTVVLAGGHPPMADWCFANLFRYCKALNSAPELPATNLTTGCYFYMFGGCTGLTETPELPSMNLAERCYQYMFSGCTGLTNAPALPATTLARSCYSLMFNGCSGLTQAPDLQATTLANYCCQYMFANCQGLKQAPALPATTLAPNCYQYMFSNCSGLTNAPALPATTLANYCYASMFNGCTGLTRLPELPATQLANYCYQYMFNGCTGVTLYENGTDPTWGIPDAQTATGWNNGMLANTGGDFTGNPVPGDIYYYTPPTPPSTAYLTFASTNAFTVTPLSPSWNGALECSTDAANWTAFTDAGAAAADNGAGEFRLHVRGTNNTQITDGYATSAWRINAPTGTVACSGNIETLLDYPTVEAGEHPAMANKCFSRLFNGCTALSRAPELPSTNLTVECYRAMFQGCTGLTEAPELPATTLAEGCYDLMFYDCAGLLEAPELPATNLAEKCYYAMFSGCTALTNAPALPAATLAKNGYSYLFNDCTSLTDAPALPATTLAPNCYQYMFAGCTALTNAPALPAATLADRCYGSMFKNCTGLTQAPALQATTLAAWCYGSMFSGCTGLTQAPALSATTLAQGCYGSMFHGCTGLTNAPALSATALADWCYGSMFQGCTGLTRLPELPATTLAFGCYGSMFKDCTGITLHETGTAPTWGIPDAQAATGWNADMLDGTGGTFTGDPEVGKTYFYTPPTPPSTAYLTFSSADTFTITPSAVSWNGDLFYSTNTTDWIAFDRDGATAALDSGSGEYRLYFRGSSNTLISGGNLAYWVINAAPATVVCSGNIETLLDYATVDGGGHPAMAANCFANLFRDCTALASAPELAATNLANNCYVGMFRGCTGLTNAPVLPATTLAGGCYQEMFRDCTSLAQAPALPATTLPSSCYKGMFTNCTALATAPELPATTLGATCYQYMFAGCTSLTNAPALQATTLVPGCYHSMFRGCTSLTQLPELPATTLAAFCYAFMFTDCTGITLHETGTAPTWGIPDVQTATGWNTNMLASTGGTFTDDPEIGKTYFYTPPTPPSTAYLTFASTNAFTVTPLSPSWNGALECSTDAANWTAFTDAGAAAADNGAGEFRLHVRGTNNTQISDGYVTSAWIINAPTGTVACSGNIETLLDYATVDNGEHPAMAARCFSRLFSGCTALSRAPELPATTLADSCYRSMFQGCVGLTEAPELPATTLADSCYRGMFRDCTGLTAAPELSATTLAVDCYGLMFYDCTGLREAPELPATTLAESCYGSMFRGCTALTNAPALSATTLAKWCYYAMFQGCTSLTEAPELSAATLATGCYSIMFSGCTGLTETPELPAMTLANYCYESMFRDCTSLTRLPTLPGTNLTASCYRHMFAGCSDIKVYSAGSGMEWSIPAEAIAVADDWNELMLDGTGGTFTDNPVIGATYYYTPATPPVSTAYLTFASTNTFNITPLAWFWDGGLEYSTDAAEWHELTTTGADAALGGFGDYRLHIRGTNNTCVGSFMFGWDLDATAPVACSGNIETLLDYPTVEGGAHPAMGADCFGNLFKDWTWLVSAPALPATTLTNRCYASMFEGCTSLESAPALPAATLAEECYRDMFRGCTALTEAPGLPAGTLFPYCYDGMFKDCTSLTTAPALAATDLAGYCCRYMFEGCTALTNAPVLAAETLASHCYFGMFKDCTALAQTPELPATNLASYCCYQMFAGCTNLTQAPALPAGTLAGHCYDSMFKGCTGLAQTPALAATNLATHCYANMFEGCTALTRLPELPATVLDYGCYGAMFKDCTGIALHAEGLAPTWGIPDGAQEETGWNTDMLLGTGGTFTGDPEIGALYYYNQTPVPPFSETYLTFASRNAFTITPQTNSWDGALYCSTDATNWVDFTTAGAVAGNASGEYRLYLCGTGNSRITGSAQLGWTIAAAGTVACVGNIETLLDYVTVDNGGHPAMAGYCFASLFQDCTALVSAPVLPSTNLTAGCYHSLFKGCTGLAAAPVLPAAALADYGYQSMFEGCTALAQAPALPATALADFCYGSMFQDCTALTQAPSLPAAALAMGCYSSMFRGCTALASAPALNATTLADYCCQNMFRDCTVLSAAPALPATVLAEGCYQHMFRGCTGLSRPPALPATTLAEGCYRSTAPATRRKSPSRGRFSRPRATPRRPATPSS